MPVLFDLLFPFRRRLEATLYSCQSQRTTLGVERLDTTSVMKWQGLCSVQGLGGLDGWALHRLAALTSGIHALHGLHDRGKDGWRVTCFSKQWPGNYM